MPTSDAQIQANRQNAARSTGPRTEAGKERSRANSYKHGMTGAGVVLSEADAREVARRSESFVRETNAQGDIQVSLAHRAAVNSVRMERGADQQIAAQTERLRQVEADFVPPEGISDEEANQLRTDAVRRAAFDPSKEAILARRYEFACERSFYRALKELHKIQLEAEAQSEARFVESTQQEIQAQMALILQQKQEWASEDAAYEKFHAELEKKYPPKAEELAQSPYSNMGSNLSFAVGRPR